MKPILFAFLASGLILLDASASPTPFRPLEEACRTADLVVLGKLQEVKQDPADANGIITCHAVLMVKEALYGRPPEKGLPVLWHSPSPEAQVPTGWTLSPFESARDGREGLWMLHLVEGVGRADHPDCFVSPSLREEALKAVQTRLAPLRQSLEKAPAVDAYHLEICWDGHVLLSPAGEAYGKLLSAGPGALPTARALLQEDGPVAKAWGCLLFKHLTPQSTDLQTLMEAAGNPSEVPVDLDGMEEVGGMKKGSTVPLASLALQALGRAAGKEFKTCEEAEAWVAQKSKAP